MALCPIALSLWLTAVTALIGSLQASSFVFANNNLLRQKVVCMQQQTRQFKGEKRKWFPTRQQENMNYDSVVQSLFVRHVMLETEDMADLVLRTYLHDSKEEEDPFGSLARDISTCVYTRHERGQIGWIDNPFFVSSSTVGRTIPGNNHNQGVHHIVSPEVIQNLFEARPKGGDITKIKHSSGDKLNTWWHLCQVTDIQLRPTIFHSQQKDDGTANKIITTRSKLKGQGSTPLAPRISSSASFFDQSVGVLPPVAKTYHIATSGCQMNVADSERLEGVLQTTLALRPTSDPNTADVIILNTCTIRDHAEQKVYDALGPHAARKRRGKDAVALVVTGCVAQQEGEALLRRVPEVDLVMGPQYIPKLGDLLSQVSLGHQMVATDPTLYVEDWTRPVRGHAVRAWVNIIHGCNEHCTYCVVPAVRGIEQSRSMEHILEECLELANDGYKEVTLLGQNIDAYGRDMMPKRTFADLLHYLNDRIPNGTIERIRYVTSHPRYFSNRVITAVATLDKVCECFHMPFQSGDDGVLKAMRRGYTFDSYMHIIDKIRTMVPDASICGDVIVGFPGEDEVAFRHTLDLMERVRFDNLNTFAYSPRPNTEAALWRNQVPEDVKKERLAIVQQLAARHGMERSTRYVGKVVEVLVESRNGKHIQQVTGRTRQGRQVFFDGNMEELQGCLVHVEIQEARPWSLLGRRIE